MIKNFLSAVLSFVLFISCNSNSSANSAKEEEETQKDEKKITKRDFSITPSNAYNSLFFDSAAMVKFFTDNKIENKIIRRMTSFYNARNYQLAWFTNDGLTEQARGFWNMHNYQTTYANDTALKDKSLQTKMDGFTAEEDGFTVSPSDKNIISTELKLTQHFILYTLNNIEDGFVKRKEMERFIPRKKEDALLLTDSLLSKKHKNNKYYEDINNSYKLLKEKLETYYTIAKQGGWPQITGAAKQLKKGISSPDIVILKKRLQFTNDMAADTTPVFNETLESGIKNFQIRFGYTPTGILTDGQIKDMNVPVVNRIQQLLINMGRMQWMISEPKGQMIVVNIPEFILHVKDGPKKVFDMNVVVGKEGHNTMMFTGNLNQVVFSPYWNLPESIIKKEILPAMERNPNYLASHHMEITGNEGGLPVIRQLPGDDNSLGKVKFLFPNSFNIYFHDTPAKSLFDKDKRAYSHGCIRLSDPVKMANYILKDNEEWNTESIDAAMNSNEEKYVKVKNPIPVLITYYTAWVDENGLLHFADDIYGHDKNITEKMFAVK
jgi:L,D-transpeptidase YcbB